MRIAFLGTPEFALPSLSALYDAGHTLAVFTQPDRPVGRRAVITPSAVKRLALSLDLPVYCFEKLRGEEGLQALRGFAPELVVTCAFGQFLSRKCLELPPLGTINVHASLLPRYRGASPIQSAVIAGERETGVTTMLTSLRMDEGDILLQDKTEIGENETYGELSDRLSMMGARLLIRTVDEYAGGRLTPIPQDNRLATVCHMLTKDDGRIDFNKGAKEVHDLIRGTQPWPEAFAMLDGQPLKLIASRLLPDLDAQGEAGILRCFDRTRLALRCADAWLEILTLQSPGGKRLSAADYMRGKPLDGKLLL